jgi:hypothetical protein
VRGLGKIRAQAEGPLCAGWTKPPLLFCVRMRDFARVGTCEENKKGYANEDRAETGD